MPLLELGFLFTDPLLSDTFVVTRRSETFDTKGRPVITRNTLPPVTGVVMPISPAKVERRDDGQIVEHAIQIHAAFAFIEASAGYQPDEILWQGRTYFVDTVQPYSHFGGRNPGFQKVTAISVKATDQPQFTG